jgi:hypothetical protein
MTVRSLTLRQRDGGHLRIVLPTNAAGHSDGMIAAGRHIVAARGAQILYTAKQPNERGETE